MGLHAARVLEVHGDRQVHICLPNICAINGRRVAGGTLGGRAAVRAPTCGRSPDARSGTEACSDGSSITVGTVAFPGPGAGALVPVGSQRHRLA